MFVCFCIFFYVCYWIKKTKKRNLNVFFVLGGLEHQPSPFSLRAGTSAQPMRLGWVQPCYQRAGTPAQPMRLGSVQPCGWEYRPCPSYLLYVYIYIFIFLCTYNLFFYAQISKEQIKIMLNFPWKCRTCIYIIVWKSNNWFIKALELS